MAKIFLSLLLVEATSDSDLFSLEIAASLRIKTNFLCTLNNLVKLFGGDGLRLLFLQSIFLDISGQFHPDFAAYTLIKK